MDFSLSRARAVKPEGILPIRPHQRTPYESPPILEDGLTAATLAPFSANSNVWNVELSEGIADQLADTPNSYPVASYLQPGRDPIDRFRPIPGISKLIVYVLHPKAEFNAGLRNYPPD